MGFKLDPDEYIYFVYTGSCVGRMTAGQGHHPQEAHGVLLSRLLLVTLGYGVIEKTTLFKACSVKKYLKVKKQSRLD